MFDKVLNTRFRTYNFTFSIFYAPIYLFGHFFVNEHSSLAKCVRLRNKSFWVRLQVQSLKLQTPRLLRARSSLTFRQL